MRLLVVHPGAQYSTHDVFVSLYAALRLHGHEVHAYQLAQRLDRAYEWLNFVWRKAGKPEPRPNDADVVYLASAEVLERALRFEVDGVLAISGMYLHPNVMVLLRRAGVSIGVVFTESPYDDRWQYRIAPLADVCWTNERISVAPLRWANERTYYLPHAYNADAHAALTDLDDVPAHDVVFVGTAFQERIEALEGVDWSGIDLALYGEWRMLPSRHRLRKYLRGGLTDNRVAIELYRKAKIGLNLYRTSAGFTRDAPRITHAESMNPRAYDLAAAGAFQLSSYRSEVAEVFGPTVPTFETPEQLGALIRAYLPDDEGRALCAAEARRLVAPHTYAARAEQLIRELREAWQQPIAKGA